MSTLHDAADLPQAATMGRKETVEAVCTNCGKSGDASCPHCGSQYGPANLVEDYGFRPATTQEMLPRLARLARLIASKRNSKFIWTCYLIASGDAYADGVSMEEVAKRWKVTRACVSKHCVMICTILGMPPSRYMRSKAARKSYKLTNARRSKPWKQTN